MNVIDELRRANDPGHGLAACLPNVFNLAIIKIERQQAALLRAKTYMEREPPNESTANVLEIINGVLDSDEYNP